MLPPVFQTLKASSAVKAIVGTNPPRIYRHGSAPQRPDGLPLSDPYITWFMVTGSPENNLSNDTTPDRQSVQIDCWHQTDAGVEVLADAVRAAVEPTAHITSVSADEREPETRLYRIAIECDFWGR
jgi:hypothetical protein